MTKQALAEAVREQLAERPKQKARELATTLGVESKEVNSVLYGLLSGEVFQDGKYRWSLAGGEDENGARVSRTTEFADTQLAKLVRYYLACMGQDERGVSVFASGNQALDYVELPVLPADGDIFRSPKSQELLGRSKRQVGRMELFFGYPVVLRHHRARRSNWEGFFVEPLFLFPIDTETDSEGPSIDLGFPVVNQKAMSSLTEANRDHLVTAILELEEDLGLLDGSEPPPLDEMVLRLAAQRGDWPWVETIDLDEPVTDPPLSEAQEAGLYNRAVLVMAERSPFTKGLEAELKQLGQMEHAAVSKSALGDWLTGKVEETVMDAPPAPLEVLPLNTEQRQAIRSSFGRKLTVITGPPGTGKSQVVTSLLITAAWEGKRVLFASKNNKAVDVVETRVNELGPRPVLLRLGANEYQAKLAEYLMSMLAVQTTLADRETYQEAKEHHERITQALAELDDEMKEVVDLRNQVDRLEAEAEESRAFLAPEVFRSLKNRDLGPLREAVRALENAMERADRERQPFYIGLLWPFLGGRRLAELAETGEAVAVFLEELGLETPTGPVTDAMLPTWKELHQETSRRLEGAERARSYMRALDRLQEVRSLEGIAREKGRKLSDLSRNAETLWNAWLKVQPGEMTTSDRTKLSQYRATLKMVLDAPPGDRLARNVYRTYQKAQRQLGHLMSCWAVTSLSARGRVPFQPGHFDLVVFDEASQCDIASALPLLFRAKQAVVIGDPKQLSHISSVPRGHDHRLLETYGLLEDYPHWAYSYQSLFDLAAGLVPAEGLVNLRDHHRSDADIIGFSNEYFYEGRLRVATRYNRLKRLDPDSPAVRWITVRGRAERPGRSGAQNVPEAKAVVEFLRDLVLSQGYDGSVGVVTPFRAQANRIQRLVNQDEPLAEELHRREFLADTVHKFQGDERDLMVFSPVVASGLPAGASRFLENNGNLFNVAITRARGALVIVGDLQSCLGCDVSYLKAFAAYCGDLRHREEAESAQATSALGPEYPVVNNPHQVSDWERLLYRALYGAGVRPIPQYRVENYALDLAIFVGERRLDVEVDGERYHKNWTGELCRRDELRNQRLFELGWDVMRFWVYEVRDDLDGCVRRVREWVERVEGA